MRETDTYTIRERESTLEGEEQTKEINRQMDRETDRQTGRQAGRQADRPRQKDPTSRFCTEASHQSFKRGLKRTL